MCRLMRRSSSQKVTGLADGALVQHRSGDKVSVGAIEIELIHTPGHTPGSQCFFVDGRLVAGDTLFLDGCGRTDFPGSSPEEMYESLTHPAVEGARRRGALPRSPVLDRVLCHDGHHPRAQHRLSAEDP